MKSINLLTASALLLLIHYSASHFSTSPCIVYKKINKKSVDVTVCSTITVTLGTAIKHNARTDLDLHGNI